MDMYNLKQIPSEAQIRKYLRRAIFGKNVFCPECGSYKVWQSYERYRRPDCRIRFSLTSHTWLNNMELPLATVVAAAVVLDDSYSHPANPEPDGIKRSDRTTLVRPVSSAAAAGNPCAGTYRPDGRSLRQRLVSDDGQTNRLPQAGI